MVQNWRKNTSRLTPWGQAATILLMTVREIAELAEVSIGTVDRVLYKRGRVSAETRAKIEGIIEKYHFTPNPLARQLKRNRPYLLCALIPRRDQDAGYWGQALFGIQGGADEVEALGVRTEISEFDRYDPKSFGEAADMVLSKNPDGIVFAPIMPDRTSSFIMTAQERGIPYVFFDADIPGMTPLCTIGQDSFQGGYLAGRLMDLLGRNFEKPAAVLDAHGEEYHITRRRDGFLQYAAEHNIPTVTKEYSDFLGTELSVEKIIQFLEENPELSGIFITNCLAHRVTAAVEKTRGAKDIVIIGYDLIPNNYLFLKEGRIDAIISQRPETQGRQALLSLYRHLVMEQRVPEKLDIPLDVYFKENLPRELP
jgi:LacI family transcriptional regulator